jgi:flagellar biosynthesis/type III secretory pathway protein FliH
MVAGGISPEEVAQRETEQFEKGLAQARADAAIELAEAVRRATEDALAKGMAQAREEMAAEHAEAVRQATEDAREQALAQGKEEGLAEGLAQGRDEGHAQGLAEGKEQGSSEGEAQVRAELADEMAAQREVFENAAKALHDVLADPKQFFEPVKRLAMHIAEQIVVGELQTSSKGIERLVQRCLDEMDHPVQGAVVLELNPQDKALLQEQAADFTKGMRLEAIHDMPRGSVRVFANDTVIEDLVEHRLEGLAKALLMDVDAWREKSPLAQRILEVQEEVGGDDVHS